MHQQKVLQGNSMATEKVNVGNSYNKTLGGNTPQSNYNNSSDRSMHGPYSNITSSSAQNMKQTPTLTVTPGRADHTISGRDISNASTNKLSDVIGSTGRQVDRLGVPQKEDSGTESGEDLRLIAAGLRDQLQMKSDSNIIDDVTCALSRLESSLKEGKDISVDDEKRKALLALVARLQDGLTCPEKLAEIAAAMSELDGNDVLYGETSSPEADAHRSGKQRFAKRRSRVNRHTVGVSREELADARRYMEDMLVMGNISNNTTPDATTNSPPQWFPLEKNASSGAILVQQPLRLQPDNIDFSERKKWSPTNNGKRRPVSGDFSVSFEPTQSDEIRPQPGPSSNNESANQRLSPENGYKNQRFSNKKLLMKRANTIDLAKAKRIGSDFDTDSEAEDKSQLIGLKRAIHPTVKKRVQNVVPPFEPKTENDRKFLAFINKQSDKPGLGWSTNRSVANWTNKFGNLKNSFEVGATTAVSAAKPPPVPGHQLKLNPAHKQPPPSQHRDVYSYSSSNQQIAQRLQQEAERQAQERRKKQEYEAHQNRDPSFYYNSNQQIAQRLLQEADRQAEERRRKLEYERMIYEQREREKVEHQRQVQKQQQLQQQQQERLQKERLEREYYERHMREHDSRTQRAQHPSPNTIPQPLPINEFKHAPQSVFRPIDNGETMPKPIYKPIPQLPKTVNTWQPPSASNNPFAKADNSFITSPPPSSKSPIGLPWAAKPAVDASSFKNKASKFEERSKYDNYCNLPQVQRHNSLRMPNINSGQNDDFKKRPSLPNTTDPFGIQQNQPNTLSYLPPPTNISYVYDTKPSKPTYLSYPCLPTAVTESPNYRSREDSLTNPQAVPLVLTSANPSYCPENPQFLNPNTGSHFDITSPPESSLNSPSGPSVTTLHTDCTDDDIETDSLLEYHAVSRVMSKPQSQTAVTVGRRTGHVSDDEVYGKNSKAAKNLLSTMKSIGNSNGDAKRATRSSKRAELPTSPKICLSPDGRSYQAPIVEPLFPDVTRFESNRQPHNERKTNNQPMMYSQPQRKQPTMYKSMENISMHPPTTTKNSGFVPQQPPQLKPYVSETQTSYVVTYPADDTTDDEEIYRHTHKAAPDYQPLRRTRNISESSTVSSTTASATYANNIPSPNTSWTSNPITAADVIPGSPNLYNHTTNESQYQKPLKGDDLIMSSHQYQPKYQPTQYGTMPEQPAQYRTVPDSSKAINNNNYTTSQHVNASPLISNNKNYDSSSYNTTASTKAVYNQETTIHKMTPKAQPPKQQKQPAQPPQQINLTKPQPQAPKPLTNKSKLEEKPTIKKSLAHTGKSISADYVQEQTTTVKVAQKTASITAKKSNQEQREENISYTNSRRQSYGNTINGEINKTTISESNQQTIYKSSAPADTPDIVKSSLPKDENQPILKKFGPPQRHHYMPNSYKNPMSSSDKSSTNTFHTKTVETTTNHKSILKGSQQIAKSSKPLIVENPATPQPDDDYIPRNIVFNNVHAFTSLSRRQDEERSQNIDMPIRTNKLCKSESWKQIINLQNQNAPQPTTRLPQPPINELRRTKSGHSLAMPKMYEAAIDKTEINEKQNIMAAYFAANKSPTQQEQTYVEQTKRSVINRTKTSEKISASRKSLGSQVGLSQGGLTRSATMPHIANVNLLDESNVEDAFEQLMMGS